MANAVAAAKAQAAKHIPSGMMPKRRPRRSPRGRYLSRASLLAPAFRQSLGKALKGLSGEVTKLGVESEEQLRKIIVEAYRRLGGTHRITATLWLGMAFEIIGSGLPDVIMAESGYPLHSPSCD